MTERPGTGLSTTFAKIAVHAVIGAVLGLLAGLLLMALFDGKWVDNPFWAMSAGIFVGAMVAGTPRGG